MWILNDFDSKSKNSVGHTNNNQILFDKSDNEDVIFIN